MIILLFTRIPPNFSYVHFVYFFEGLHFFSSFVSRVEMDYFRTLCTRRKEYTFANGIRNAQNHQSPPSFVALPENGQPLTEAEREARRVRSDERRAQAILRAENREAEIQRRERETATARRLEIQQAAQEICNRGIENLRQEFQAEINRIREPEPPEVQVIAVMPTPIVDLIDGGAFS